MARRQWLGFFALCLLGASTWPVEGAWPSLMPAASRECLHDLIIAFAVGVFGWRRIAFNEIQTRLLAKLALASVCLLGMPAALIESARSGVSEGTIAALFAMLPVAVVLLVSRFDFAGRAEPGTTRMLAPAIIGLTGTLLLLPFALPASFREASLYALVVLAVLVAASASVWMYRLLLGADVVEAVVICCVANAMFLLVVSLASIAIGGASWGGAWSWNTVGVEALKAVCIDLPQIILLLWLMREVAPERLAARALVVPILTVLEGYALLRPEISVRPVCGAALLIYGAWRLLTSSGREEEPGLMLR